MFELLTRAPAGQTGLSEQILLEGFNDAIVTANKNGIQYDRMMYIGNWELKFGTPRGEGLLPVVYHALYFP